ncbi:HAD-IIA family hydrolase [Propionicimonas sp.]|uniref:HAD-IIA family hydrolase n=1 Tax=Propionicimonas sp. TaxID=1955623 RepID=UPI0039E3C3EF
MATWSRTAPLCPDLNENARPDRLFDAYVFDLDGTIYLGDHLLPGVAETIGLLRELHIPVRFLSNNPTKDPHQYQAKLDALGLPTPLDDIANTIVTTVRWLRSHHPDAVVFPIAELPLVTALSDAGIRLSDNPAEIDIVLASYDRGFDYRKLQIAFDALWFHKRAILVQTNPDRYCPFPGGRGEPDCAAIVAAIEACTEVTCTANFGKPDPLMVAEALDGYDVAPERTMMVGDRLATDIAMGRNAGMNTALVLTGDSTLADATDLPPRQRPHYVLETLDQLVPPDIWGRERDHRG